MLNTHTTANTTKAARMQLFQPSARHTPSIAASMKGCTADHHSAPGDPGIWPRRTAACVASLALSVQAVFGPAEALALTQSPASQSLQGMPAPPSLELQLQIAERLPPIPMDFPPLPTLTPLAHEELTLPNGLRVYLMEDHEVPAVRGTLLMRGGQRGSPPDRLGVATISAGVQRAGGSVTHPGPVLDELLEDRGAQIEGGASSDVVSMGFRCLSEDSREVLGIFADVVQRPALPKDKLQLYQAQIINFLEHQNDNPRSIPARELNRLIYGRDSVFARQPTPQQVSALTVDDLRGYLAAWERPDASVLGIVGDFDSCQMKAWVAEYFGGWQPAEGQPLQPPPLPNSPLPDQDPIAGKLFLVNIPGATQTSVAVGEPGIQLLDPDDFPLDVLNDILNSFG